MRRSWLVALLVIGACTSQGVERARRWPMHRKQGDARFAELERKSSELAAKNADLVAKNADLERRVRQLEDWVARVKKVRPAPPPDADTGAGVQPGGLPPGAP